MDSKYLVIEAESLEAAKLRLKTLMASMGYPLHNYEYITGERNIGYANDRVIRNNIVIQDHGQGYYIFEFDLNIVAQFEDDIIAVLPLDDLHWCTKEETSQYQEEVL